MKDNYEVERRIALLCFLQNLFLISASSLTTIALFSIEHSWWALWALAPMALQKTANFIRD